MTSETRKYQGLLLGIAGIAALVGALGLRDTARASYSGLAAGPNGKILRILAGSPAAEAGLEVGDVIRSIGGISVGDTKANSRRPRAEIGETRTFVVERAGERREFDVTYAPQSRRNRIAVVISFTVALCFVVFCVWAYRAAPSSITRVLAFFGLCFGLAFLPVPYAKSFALRTIGGALATVLVVTGFALLVHFLMRFPKRRAFLDRPWAKELIYGPAIAVNVYLLFINLVQPDFTGTLKTVTLMATGLFVAGYFGWALVLMVQSFLRASPEERSRDGLTLMLVATLVGLLPVTLTALAIRMSILLPGGLYYGFTLGLIPIAFAMAAVRQHRAIEPG